MKRFLCIFFIGMHAMVASDYSPMDRNGNNNNDTRIKDVKFLDSIIASKYNLFIMTWDYEKDEESQLLFTEYIKNKAVLEKKLRHIKNAYTYDQNILDKCTSAKTALEQSIAYAQARLTSKK